MLSFICSFWKNTRNSLQQFVPFCKGHFQHNTQRESPADESSLFLHSPVKNVWHSWRVLSHLCPVFWLVQTLICCRHDSRRGYLKWQVQHHHNPVLFGVAWNNVTKKNSITSTPKILDTVPKTHWCLVHGKKRISSLITSPLPSRSSIVCQPKPFC